MGLKTKIIKTYYCDVCKCKITKKNMVNVRPKSILLRLVYYGLIVTHKIFEFFNFLETTDIDDIIICKDCFKSYLKWFKSRGENGNKERGLAKV